MQPVGVRHQGCLQAFVCGMHTISHQIVPSAIKLPGDALWLTKPTFGFVVSLLLSDAADCLRSQGWTNVGGYSAGCKVTGELHRKRSYHARLKLRQLRALLTASSVARRRYTLQDPPRSADGHLEAAPVNSETLPDSRAAFRTARCMRPVFAGRSTLSRAASFSVLVVVLILAPQSKLARSQVR